MSQTIADSVAPAGSVSTGHDAIDRVIDAHLDAEMAGDIPAVLATMTADAEHISHPTPPEGARHGHAEISDFYQHMFAEFQPTGRRPVRRLYGDGFVVDEMVLSAVATGHPFGLDGQRRTVEVPLLHVFQFESGLISYEAGWLDFAALAGQLT